MGVWVVSRQGLWCIKHHREHSSTYLLLHICTLFLGVYLGVELLGYDCTSSALVNTVDPWTTMGVNGAGPFIRKCFSVVHATVLHSLWGTRGKEGQLYLVCTFTSSWSRVSCTAKGSSMVVVLIYSSPKKSFSRSTSWSTFDIVSLFNCS